MIEVGCDALGIWAWTMISAAGRTLVYLHGFEDEASALASARRYRAAMMVTTWPIDHRMGASI